MTAAQYATAVIDEMIASIQEYLDDNVQPEVSPVEVEGLVS